MSPRAQPRRTCIGCRQVRAKIELLRMTRRPDGRVEVDGRGAGRGAYVCASEECVARALKGSRLAQAFRKPCEAGETLTRWISQR